MVLGESSNVRPWNILNEKSGSALVSVENIGRGRTLSKKGDLGLFSSSLIQLDW